MNQVNMAQVTEYNVTSADGGLIKGLIIDVETKKEGEAAKIMAVLKAFIPTVTPNIAHVETVIFKFRFTPPSVLIEKDMNIGCWAAMVRSAMAELSIRAMDRDQSEEYDTAIMLINKYMKAHQIRQESLEMKAPGVIRCFCVEGITAVKVVHGSDAHELCSNVLPKCFYIV